MMPEEQTFQAAIFDLDGTLLDSMHIWTDIDEKFLQKRGLSVPEGYGDALAHLTFRETAEYTIQYFHLSETPEAIMHEWNQMAIDAYSHHVQLKPHAKEYLLYLKERSIRLGVCTSLSKNLYVPALQNLGIWDWFDAIVGTDDVNRSKCYPEPYLLTAARLGTPPRDCIVFEDILEAVKGAKQAHMRVYAIYDDDSAHQAKEIKALADHYFFDFAELMKE